MAPSSPSFSPVFRETLETLMSQGHGIDKLIVGHKVADEAFELARLGDNGAPSKEKCGRAGDLLAAVILSGVIGNYGEFSLIRLGEIVYQVLKANSESLSTRIVMAFLFAAVSPLNQLTGSPYSEFQSLFIFSIHLIEQAPGVGENRHRSH